MAFRTLVLDFDGTCTDFTAAGQAFLDAYWGVVEAGLRQTGAAIPAHAVEHAVNEQRAIWQRELRRVAEGSPERGWQLLPGSPPAAPAAADPYILAGEAAKALTSPAPPDAFRLAAERAPAPFRPELLDVLRAAARAGAQVAVISNSDQTKVTNRLADLLSGAPELAANLSVHGDAAKFSIGEPAASVPSWLRARFAALPAGARDAELLRPIYLRRAKYLAALGRVWGDDAEACGATLVCGDIWELDLALPAALGCAVHLVRRPEAYGPYAYEERAVAAARPAASMGSGLSALIDRLAG